MYRFFDRFRPSPGYSSANSRSFAGFTLIELLTVIAIIGLLASIVIVGLDTARAKSRDGKRIADIKQLQLSLELFFDANGGYPANLSKLVPTYESSIPQPPGGTLQLDYSYSPLNANCTSFHLGAALELSSNSYLTDDSDAPAGTAASNCPNPSGGDNTPTARFDGTANLCSGTTAAATDLCYDVGP